MKKVALLVLLAVFSSAFADAGKKKTPSPRPQEAVPETQPPVTYDFRGAVLGMGLSDFRKLPFPDAGTRTAEERPELICTGDKGRDDPGGLLVTRNDAYLGIVNCAWYLPPYRPQYRSPWRDVMLVVGEHVSNYVRYSFVKPPGADEPRLYEIFISMGSSSFSMITDALAKRFGKPHEIKVAQVQNGIGNSFRNFMITWDSGITSILVEERFSTIDEMAIRYSHTSLTKFYFGELRKLNGGPKL